MSTGSAKRLCENCGETRLVHVLNVEWAAVLCPACHKPYGRPLTMGLDSVEDPSAPGWPSGETIERARDAKWDAFVHPSKAK
jgi:hypothetical protein